MLKIRLIPATGTTVVLALCALSTQAATLAAGYTTGAGSQLVAANGGAGAILFEDNGVTGGSDLNFNGTTTTTGFSYVINAGGNWGLGDTVDFTGLALPLWTSSTTPEVTTNNTASPATITFSFYSGGANNDWEGTNNLGTSDDSLIGTVAVDYTGTAVSAYYVNFDSPISWTADSTQVVFHVSSTGSMRIKAGNGATLADSRTNGSSLAGRAASLAGTVTPVPEPSAALLAALGALGLLRRRR